MINTLSDFLYELIKFEKEFLDNNKIKHPPTIGKMYEGLTGSILNKILFDGIDLRIIKNSFIKGCDTEFDVLIVEGDGDKLPYQESYIYPADQIIAIISVKKKIYSSDLKDGFANLQFIVDSYKDYKMKDYQINLLRDSFKIICQKDINEKGLTDNEKLILETLRIEACMPIRILWGYGGFANERNMREKMTHYLSKNVSTDYDNPIKGYGPQNFPNLIICGSSSILKLNGMPFAHSGLEEEWWNILATSSNNPIYFLMEMVWTRMSYKYPQISLNIFGEDLSIDVLNRYFDCKLKCVDIYRGWEFYYTDIKLKDLISNKNVEWKPFQITNDQHAFLMQLGKCGEINILEDVGLNELIKASDKYSTIDELIDPLCDAKLVYKINNIVKYLTDYCQVIFCPDGTAYAADNKSGKLTRWAMKHFN